MLGFEVMGLGFKVLESAFDVLAVGFVVLGTGFEGFGLGFGVLVARDSKFCGRKSEAKSQDCEAQLPQFPKVAQTDPGRGPGLGFRVLTWLGWEGGWGSGV